MKVTFSILFALLLAIWVPAGFGQDLEVVKQSGNQFFGVEADATGAYAVVDSSFEDLPGSNLGLRVLSLRKLHPTTAAEVWRRDLYSHPTRASGSFPAVAMDSSGIYTLVSVAVPGPLYIPTVQKFNRNGDLLWSSEIFPAQNGAGQAIAVFDGTVYATTRRSNTVYELHKLNAADGTPLATVPIESTGFDRHLQVDASGIYRNYGINPAVVAKYNLDGQLEWTRTVGNGFFGVNALMLHPTGVYVGGSESASKSGKVFRFDSSGNLTSEFQVAPDPGGIAAVNALAGASDRIYVVGNANQIPGQISYGFNDVYVRAVRFDGEVLSTTFFGTDQVDLVSDAAISNGSLWVVGNTAGTFAGNDPSLSLFPRGYAARLTLPPPPTESLSNLLNALPPSGPANGLKGKLGALCNQLATMRRDVERARGSQIPAPEADIILSKLGEIGIALGCAQ